MAIDNTNKRRSAQNLPWFVICPAPDGTISRADRELVAGYYCGIPAAGATIITIEKMLLSLTGGDVNTKEDVVETISASSLGWTG